MSGSESYFDLSTVIFTCSHNPTTLKAIIMHFANFTVTDSAVQCEYTLVFAERAIDTSFAGTIACGSASIL